MGGASSSTQGGHLEPNSPKCIIDIITSQMIIQVSNSQMMNISPHMDTSLSYKSN